MPTIRTRRPSRVRNAIAAGGVVLRHRDGAREVVLTGRHADGTWVFPKGTPDKGEEIEDTGDGEDEEDSPLAEFGASGAAPIVARDLVVIARGEIDSSSP